MIHTTSRGVMQQTLDQMKAGETAGVVAILAIPERAEHLAARGIVPGVEIAVIRGGDPLMIRVGECRWAISRQDARSIEIIPLTC